MGVRDRGTVEVTSSEVLFLLLFPGYSFTSHVLTSLGFTSLE